MKRGMNGLALDVLVLLIPLLLVVAATSFIPRLNPVIVPVVAACLSATGFLTAFAALIVRLDPALFTLPGLAAGQLYLGLDPLTAAFLLPICAAGCAGALALIDPPATNPRAGRAALALLVAALLLVLLARDAYAFAFGLLLAALVSAVAVVDRKAVLVPVVTGIMPPVVLYALIRIMGTDFEGPLAPAWGWVLMAIGGGAVLTGGWRAAREVRLRWLAGAYTLAMGGAAVVSLGLAVISVPQLAAVALEAAILFVFVNALVAPLLGLGAAILLDATGTDSLDWLGGLARGMPQFSMLMLAGAFGLAGLPLGAGFAPIFMLLRTVMATASAAAVRSSNGFSLVGLVLVFGVIAALFALSGFAAIRLFGLGFLGRPRSLRAAAAEEICWPRRAALAVLAALGLLLGLLPGPVLALIAPAIGEAQPTAQFPAGWGMAAPLGPALYVPIVLLALMAIIVLLLLQLRRRFAPQGVQEVAHWQDGFDKPPAWLPFGDPATQITATGFASPLDFAPPSWLARIRARRRR